MADPVWVLIIEHEYGVDSYVCKTEDVANKQLEEFVNTWWSVEFEDEDCPETLTIEDIGKYFNKAGENWNISLAHVIEE